MLTSLLEAQNFFTKYSKILGFGSQKDEKRLSIEGIPTRRRWVCFKKGFCRSTEKVVDGENVKDNVTDINVDPKTGRESRQVTRIGYFISSYYCIQLSLFLLFK